jgi:hypothetical protein
MLLIAARHLQTVSQHIHFNMFTPTTASSSGKLAQAARLDLQYEVGRLKFSQNNGYPNSGSVWSSSIFPGKF